MTQAIVAALVVFVVTFVVVMAAEKLLHKISHNPDRNYRWGVWVFAGLAAIYTFISNLGR